MFVFEGTVEGRIDPGTPIMVGTWGVVVFWIQFGTMDLFLCIW
jgi:hypothetical protein